MWYAPERTWKSIPSCYNTSGFWCCRLGRYDGTVSTYGFSDLLWESSSVNPALVPGNRYSKWYGLGFCVWELALGGGGMMGSGVREAWTTWAHFCSRLHGDIAPGAGKALSSLSALPRQVTFLQRHVTTASYSALGDLWASWMKTTGREGGMVTVDDIIDGLSRNCKIWGPAWAFFFFFL